MMSMCSLLLCCWKRVFAITSVSFWQNSVSLWPASFCTPRPNLPVTPGYLWLPTFAFQSPIMKRTSFWGVSSRRSCRSSWNYSTSASLASLVRAQTWITVILNGLPWKRREIILLFLKLHPSTAFQTPVDYDGYSLSSKGFLPTVVDIMVIWVKFTHSCPSSLIPKMSVFTCHLLSDQFQFALTHDLTLQAPMQYCSLQHRPLVSSPVTSTTRCCFCFGSVPSFFLELFLHSSPVASWAPTNLRNSSFSVLFALSYCSWGSQGKNTEVVFHPLLQWTTFCQNSAPWPDCLGWPYIAWLMVSLS